MNRYLITVLGLVLLSLTRNICAQDTTTETDTSSSIPFEDATTDASTSNEISTESQVSEPAVTNSNPAGAGSTASPTTGANTTDDAGSTATTTPTSTPVPFQCYVGNCSGVDCHKNESIYSTLSKIPCTAKQCSIMVYQNSSWAQTEFTCNTGNDCICEMKVTDRSEMCCKSSECNNQNLKCTSSSNLATSLNILVFASVILYLLN